MFTCFFLYNSSFTVSFRNFDNNSFEAYLYFQYLNIIETEIQKEENW